MQLNPTALAVIRILGGHSQASLSRVAGVSQGHISALESGGKVSPAMLHKLADALGVPIAALITDPTPAQVDEAMERIGKRLPYSKATTKLAERAAS